MTIDNNSMQPFFKALIENSRDIVMLLNADGIIQYLSPSITTLFGYNDRELLQTLVFDRVHEEDRNRAASGLQQIMAGNDIAPFIVRFRHKNGNWKFVEVIAHYLGQDISDVMLTARDVTEFEAHTQARRLIDASFEAAFSASSAINSISIVETGELVSVNDSWVDALGWTREEAIGKTANDLNVWGNVQNRAKVLSTMEKNGGLRAYRAELTTKTGEICVVRIDAAYLHLPAGTRLYFSALNITEQEKTEEKLRQSQRLEAIGHLTGGIAHDFNNLLSVIMGHAELAKSNLHQTVQVIDSLDAIFRASASGANLIQQLLSFSKKQRLSPVRLKLHEHLESMRPLLQTTIAKDIKLEITRQSSDWFSLIDPHMLDNAILNMTINARDAMPNGGVLEFCVAEQTLSEAVAQQHELAAGDYIQLTIRDTGLGMTEDAIEHAFDPFYTTKQDLGGSGLGLSMVFGFISQSGGSVSIESNRTGTAITLLLPRAVEDTEDDSPILAEQARPAINKTVLLVEDNPDVRLLVARMLQSLGFQVTEVESAQQAEALEQTRFDLLVCDLMLPGSRKGTEIAARFKQNQSNLAVLYMSGYQEGILTTEDLQAANIGFIQKPFRKDKFTAKITELLNEH